MKLCNDLLNARRFKVAHLEPFHESLSVDVNVGIRGDCSQEMRPISFFHQVLEAH